MKYYYHVKMFLADEKKRNEIDLRKWKSELEETRQYYNEISPQARNPKRILSMEICERNLDIILESAVMLDTPAHGLRIFSTRLVQSDFGRAAVAGHKLFRAKAERIDPPGNDTPSGPELVKLLVELVVANREEDIPLMEEITRLLVEWRKQQ